MQAKPVIKVSVALTVLVTAGLLSIGIRVLAQDEAKAPPPIQVVVFDNPPTYGDDVPKVVVQTRDALRENKRLEVLLFNPDSPTFILAAKSANLSLLASEVQSTEQQIAVTNAVGASYLIVLTPSDRGKRVTIDIVEAQDGSDHRIAKPESPGDASSDIANVLLSWAPNGTQPPDGSGAGSDQAPAPAPTSVPSAAPLPSPIIVTPAPIGGPPAPEANAPSLAPPVVLPTPVVVTPAPEASTPSPVPPVVPPAPIVATPAPEANALSLAPTVVQAEPVEPGAAATEPSPMTNPSPPVLGGSPALSQASPDIVVPPTLDLGDRSEKPAPQVLANPPIAVVTDKPAESASVSTVHALPVPPPLMQFVPTTALSPAPTMQPTQTVPVTPPPSPIVPEIKAITQPAAAITPPASSPSFSVVITGVTDGTTDSPPAPAITQEPTPTDALGSTLTDAAKNLIDQGDSAAKMSDYLTAIGFYHKAVDLAPRAISPRLKLANAYQQDGLKDQASEEARRALAIDPGNTDVQQFIQAQDVGAAGPSGDVVIAQAQTESDPTNPAGWISLGDAYWNVGDPDDSLISYKKAADIDPTAILPQTRLAKLYAARAQYDLSLAALQRSGPAGYPYALRIISSRSESLIGDMDDETERMVKGTDTREQFYDKIKATSSQAEELADFVAKITPPDQYKVSQLHRELSTSLLAQTTSVWVDYAETNNDSDKNQAALLEKNAIEEMKTASVAEDLQSRIKP